MTLICCKCWHRWDSVWLYEACVNCDSYSVGHDVPLTEPELGLLVQMVNELQIAAEQAGASPDRQDSQFRIGLLNRLVEARDSFSGRTTKNHEQRTKTTNDHRA